MARKGTPRRGGVPVAHARRRRPESHRQRARRCARRDSNGGAARGAPHRWRTAVLHARVRFRLLQERGRIVQALAARHAAHRCRDRDSRLPPADRRQRVLGHPARRARAASGRGHSRERGVRRGRRRGEIPRERDVGARAVDAAQVLPHHIVLVRRRRDVPLQRGGVQPAAGTELRRDSGREPVAASVAGIRNTAAQGIHPGLRAARGLARARAEGCERRALDLRWHRHDVSPAEGRGGGGAAAATRLAGECAGHHRLALQSVSSGRAGVGCRARGAARARSRARRIGRRGVVARGAARCARARRQAGDGDRGRGDDSARRARAGRFDVRRRHRVQSRRSVGRGPERARGGFGDDRRQRDRPGVVHGEKGDSSRQLRRLVARGPWNRAHGSVVAHAAAHDRSLRVAREHAERGGERIRHRLREGVPRERRRAARATRDARR